MSTRGRVLIGAAAVAGLGLVLGMLVAVTHPDDEASSGTPAEAAEPTSTEHELDPAVAAAAAEAARTGQPAAIENQWTESREVYVNPDGTTTAVMHAMAQRVRRDGAWVDVDTTLRLDDRGRVTPTAAVLDVSFSGGGDDDLLEMSAADARLGLVWPNELPEPQLSGNTATYPQVLPGVDLQLRAEVDTLTQVLVVHDAEAAAQPALRSLRLDVEVAGGRLKTQEDGGLDLVDESGEVLLSSPPALMWDSSGAQSAGQAAPTGGKPSADQAAAQLVSSTGQHAPQEGDKMAEVVATVSDDAMTLVPDQRLLTAADTVFPVYIDPTWLVPAQNRAMVNRSHPAQSYMNWGGTEATGYITTSGTHLKRLFWNFDTSGLQGKQILGATFAAHQAHQYSCALKRVNLWTTWSFSSGVTWNNQPPALRIVGFADTALGRDGCSPGGGRVEIDARGAAEDVVANGWGQVGLALIAANESDSAGWKRFQPDAVFSVSYNTRPHTPAQSQGAAPQVPCVVGEQMPVIGEKTPSVKALLQDPDVGGSVWGDFELWESHGSLLHRVITGPMGPSDWHVAQLPSLADGKYAWRVQADDSMLDSNWSQWCEFELDTTPPATPPVVQSTHYPTDVYAGGLGVAGRFLVDGGGDEDVASFAWSVNSDAPTHTATPDVPGGAASFEERPVVFGPNVLRVWSVDRAGNMGSPTLYEFKVRGAAARAWWRLDETAGVAAADSRGRFTGVVEGDPARTEGRWHSLDAGDRALRFDGADDRVQVEPVTVEPGQNFSVSAWVRPTSMDASRTAVSMFGGSRPVLALGHLDADRRWVAGVTELGAGGAVSWSRAVGTTQAQSGQWSHLLTTYDAANGQLSLYVNGFLESTVSVTGDLDAVRAMAVGWSGPGGNGAPAGSGYFSGDVDDVRLFAGTVDADEAFRLFSEVR